MPFGRDDGRVDAPLAAAGYVQKLTNPIAASISGPIRAYGVAGIVRSTTMHDFAHHLCGADALVNMERPASRFHEHVG